MAQLSTLGHFSMRYTIPILFVAVALLAGCHSPTPVHTKKTATADFRLIRTQMLDGAYPPNGGHAPTVYVLIQPDDQPLLVFQNLGSKPMEGWLILRARGSVLHYHANAVYEPSPTAAEWDAFKTFCQAHEITLINESDRD